MNKQEPQIKYVSMDKIKPWPGNPKRHDTDLIRKSILRHGFVGRAIMECGAYT